MRFVSFLLSRNGVALLFLTAMLAACVVVEDEPGRPQRPDRNYCSRDYDPVCGRRGGDRQTFANACLADQSGYRVVRRGECRGDDGGGPQQSCTREYDPVCGRRGGERRTFPNSCEAEVAGYDIVGGGECRGGGGSGGNGGGGGRFCTQEYAPVCARRPGERARTFSNSCEADRAGWRVISDGDC